MKIKCFLPVLAAVVVVALCGTALTSDWTGAEKVFYSLFEPKGGFFYKVGAPTNLKVNPSNDNELIWNLIFVELNRFAVV